MNAENGPHVLLVEDNARDAEYLATALDGMTHESMTSAEAALERFVARPDAWLITDIQLPGMSGVELAATVWERVPDTRVVVWSQYDDEIYLRTLTGSIPQEALYGDVLENNPVATLRRAGSSVFVDEQCWIDPQVRFVRAHTRQRSGAISDAEFDALLDVALGMTDQLIARRRFLSTRGVQSRLKSLYAKLGLDRASIDEGMNPRSRAVAIALRRGLLNSQELERAEQALGEWMLDDATRPRYQA